MGIGKWWNVFLTSWSSWFDEALKWSFASYSISQSIWVSCTIFPDCCQEKVILSESHEEKSYFTLKPQVYICINMCVYIQYIHTNIYKTYNNIFTHIGLCIGNTHSWTIQCFFAWFISAKLIKTVLLSNSFLEMSNLVQVPLISPLFPCAALTFALPSPLKHLWVCPLGKWGFPFRCPAERWIPWLSCTSLPLLTEIPDEREEKILNTKPLQNLMTGK